MCNVISVNVMLRRYVWIKYDMTHYANKRELRLKTWSLAACSDLYLLHAVPIFGCLDFPIKKKLYKKSKGEALGENSQKHFIFICMSKAENKQGFQNALAALQ